MPFTILNRVTCIMSVLVTELPNTFNRRDITTSSARISTTLITDLLHPDRLSGADVNVCRHQLEILYTCLTGTIMFYVPGLILIPLETGLNITEHISSET